jgi:hypothetical protein
MNSTNKIQKRPLALSNFQQQAPPVHLTQYINPESEWVFQ